MSVSNTSTISTSLGVSTVSSRRDEFDLKAFHAGDRELLARIYRENVNRVERAVFRYLRGVDAENVVHDVFLQVIERRKTRLGFHGGDVGAWLVTIANNKAIDLLRREKRSVLADDPSVLAPPDRQPQDVEQGLLDQFHVERLQRALSSVAAEVVPTLGPKLAPIFELRFQVGLDQQTAARTLEIPRTTFIDREAKLLKQLDRYLKQNSARNR